MLFVEQNLCKCQLQRWLDLAAGMVMRAFWEGGWWWEKYGAGEISTPSRDADNLQAAPTR